MRIVQFLLLTCAVGCATTLTNSSFNNPPGDDPNVVGSYLSFDTQSISVSDTGGQVTVVIDLDFGDGANGSNAIGTSGGNQYLASFTESGLGAFYIGDLFFYDPAAPTTSYTTSCANTTPPTQCVTVPTASSLLNGYGVVLDGGDGPVNADLTTGDVYKINGSTVSTETALQAYGQNDIYRPGQVVDMTGTSGATPSGTAGHEAVCKIGTTNCGTGIAQYQVTLTFSAADLSAAFISLINSGQIGVEFSAADCGNAVLSNATPEPGTLGISSKPPT